MSFVIGLLLVIAGAFSVGTSAWPIKACKTFSMEHVLFFSMLFGLLFLPWLSMFILCDVPQVLAIIGPEKIIFANLFSMAWGLANILCCICMVKIGFVMVSVLLGGSALIVSTLIPLIFKGSGVFANAPGLYSKEGLISVLAVIVMIIAIVLISKAGDLRDKQLGKKGVEGESLSPMRNIMYKVMAIISGILSCGIFMLNTYCGSDIIGAMEKVGVTSPYKGVSIWAVGMFVGVIMNMVYALILMAKNKTFRCFSFKEFCWSLCDGLQFFVYLIIFGYGTLMMGALGASVGNGVSQCVQTGGQQFIGFVFGEWKGVKGKPVKVLVIGLILLLIGIILLSFK
ncbi:MAG: hypothetical protein IJS60_07100 [Abditibacteriota bacterium]|nr:hypothetical protein [Abditibacteriota bacterium]